jgi:hypothetical protein
MKYPDKMEMKGTEIELSFQSGWNACRKQFMKLNECEHLYDDTGKEDRGRRNRTYVDYFKDNGREILIIFAVGMCAGVMYMLHSPIASKVKELQVAETLDHSQINMLGAAVDKLLNEDVYVNEVEKSYSQSKPQIKAQ